MTAEKDYLLEGERLDDLQRSNLKIIQHPGGFCFGMDAVLLSGFVCVKPQEEEVDLCTGTGIIPLLLSAKTEGRHYLGIEIQPEMADRAKRSVKLNGLEQKIDIICGDIRDKSIFDHIKNIDVVTCNPPYMNKGLKNPDSALAIARHEINCTLYDALKCGADILKSGGRYYLVHRPHRLSEIMGCMQKLRLEPKRMRFVHPYADRPANMVLIEAVKDGGCFMNIEAPIVVYESKGKYTEEIYEIYGY